MVEILGNPVPVKRILTGLYSFDRAFINRDGDIGLPIGKGIEIYGSTFVGKSTITYGLAGIIGKIIEKDIALADFEGFDPDFLRTVLMGAGFDGSIQCIQKEEDEEALEELLDCMRKDKYGVGILDSIGAISPIAEQEGELGEANMGKRAFLMAQFVRKMLKIMRSDSPKTILMVNHAYPVIGGRGKTTPGGEVKKYLASIRIEVKRKYVRGGYEEYPDGSYVIEGTVVKNRWGLKDKKFNLFVLSGKGIHLGLSAMYDGFELGLVEKPGKKVKKIHIGDTVFGSTKEVIMKAHEGDNDFFKPFIDILQNVEHEFEESNDELQATGESNLQDNSDKD